MLSTKHCPPRTAAHPLLCRARLLHPARRLASSHACPTPCRRTSLRGLLGAVHGRCYHATHAVARRAPANDAASLRGRRGRLRHHATGRRPTRGRLRVSISSQVDRQGGGGFSPLTSASSFNFESSPTPPACHLARVASASPARCKTV